MLLLLSTLRAATNAGTIQGRIYNPVEAEYVRNAEVRLEPSGPRHLTQHPNGRFIYVNNEMSPGLVVFARDPTTGRLDFRSALPIQPDGVEAKGATTAEIFFHPNGQCLYVSVRGYNSITRYSIGMDGTALRRENVPVAVRSPRTFALAPDGRMAVVAGEGGGAIARSRSRRTAGWFRPVRKKRCLGQTAWLSFRSSRAWDKAISGGVNRAAIRVRIQ